MRLRVLAALLLVVAAGGCDTFTGGSFAEARLGPLGGTLTWGRVTFHESDGRTTVGSLFDRQAPVAQSMTPAAGMVFVRADVNNLPPNRQFTIAIHERGDCAGGAGGPGAPWAPDGAGAPRAGDLPRLSSNGEGVGLLAITTTQLTVAPGPRSVVGRAVVIRDSVEDASLPPGGKGGNAIACGLIRARD